MALVQPGAEEGGREERMALAQPEAELYSALRILFDEESADCKDRMAKAAESLSDQSLLEAAQFSGGSSAGTNIVLWCFIRVAAWIWATITQAKTIPFGLQAIIPPAMHNKIKNLGTEDQEEGRTWFYGLMGITQQTASLIRTGQSGDEHRIYTAGDAAAALLIRENIVLTVRQATCLFF